MLNGQSPSGTQLPTKNPDGTAENTPRGNGYGEVYVQPSSPDGMEVSLAEGSYFSGVASGYAPGTGVVATVQTTFSDTSAYLAIGNKAPAGSGKIVRLDTVKLVCSVASVANTNLRLIAVLDAISRMPSSGTALVFNPNGGLSGAAASISQGFVGALTPAAATAAKKIVGQSMLKSAIVALNDEIILKFTNQAPSALSSLTGATAARYVSHMEPCAILPQQCLLLHLFGTAMTTAPTFETLLTTIER